LVDGESLLFGAGVFWILSMFISKAYDINTWRQS
jgi:hypothetical protein